MKEMYCEVYSQLVDNRIAVKHEQAVSDIKRAMLLKIRFMRCG
jgi:hypothetical protein